MNIHILNFYSDFRIENPNLKLKTKATILSLEIGFSSLDKNEFYNIKLLFISNKLNLCQYF